MDDEDMIVDDSNVATPPENTNSDTPPTSTPPEEIGGALIDNDEPQDKTPEVPDDAGGDDEDTDKTDAAGDSDPTGDDPIDEVEPLPVPKVEETQPAKVDDPGDFKPNDYSFEVTLADGSKHTIKTPEDADNLPEGADFGSIKGFNEYMRNYSRMVNGLEQDKNKYDADKVAFEEAEKQQASITERIETTVREIDYLTEKGVLPKVEDKYLNADWSDPEVAKQPGVKETLDLLDFRAKENQTRVKLGLPEMSLLEAAREIKEVQANIVADEKKKTDAVNRKKAGSMVGGSTSTPPSNIPDDLIVGEGGSIRDIISPY